MAGRDFWSSASRAGIARTVGTVIGSGVFKKPQEVAENVPFFGLAALAWILGGVLALLGSLALAEVAVLYPRAGGNYVYLREAYGRLAGFLWGWVDGRPQINTHRSFKAIPAQTATSLAISKALKARGFRFVGPTTVYAFMQAVGMVNDHLVSCHRHEACASLQRRFKPPGARPPA